MSARCASLLGGTDPIGYAKITGGIAFNLIVLRMYWVPLSYCMMGVNCMVQMTS